MRCGYLTLAVTWFTEEAYDPPRCLHFGDPGVGPIADVQESIVCVDYPEGLPDVSPHLKQLPLGVEYLYAPSIAVSDVDQPLLVRGDRVGEDELPRLHPLGAPLALEVEALIEPGDPLVSVPIGDVETPVQAVGDVRGLVEVAPVLPGYSLGPQCPQHLPFGRVQVEDVPVVVYRPDVVVPIALHHVGPDERSLTPGADHLSLPVETDERGRPLPPVENIVSPLAVRGDPRDLSQHPSVGQPGPAFDDCIAKGGRALLDLPCPYCEEFLGAACLSLKNLVGGAVDSLPDCHTVSNSFSLICRKELALSSGEKLLESFQMERVKPPRACHPLCNI